MKPKLSETRQLDSLGRIVLPKKMRASLNIAENDFLLISLENNAITIRKNKPSCIFCASAENLFEIDEKYVCLNCAKKICTMSANNE